MHVLGVLKPDGVLRRAPGAKILQGLIESNLGQFLTFKQVNLPIPLLERHYHHVQGRDFYPWMIDLLTGSPACVALLETTSDALDRLRKLLGYTRAHQAHPRSLRYQFAPFGGMNGFHLSEDEQAAEVEVSLWTPALDLQPGQFTASIEAYVQRYAGYVDNTCSLREICLEIKHKGEPSWPKDVARLRDLMAEECVDAVPAQVDWLAQKLAEGCFLGEVKNPPVYESDDLFL
ncbi:MAG: hypothetical protein JW934_21095 [Anaerolineae bacterium]|nr:hypothetical protein [Anaerolineae bacterium]